MQINILVSYSCVLKSFSENITDLDTLIFYTWKWYLTSPNTGKYLSPKKEKKPVGILVNV